jgi:hypothetical protein
MDPEFLESQFNKSLSELLQFAKELPEKNQRLLGGFSGF